MALRLRAAWLAVAVAALATAALTIALAPAHAANLLVNGGFETGSLSGWTCT
ncbi:MAG: chitinase, partial [Micromonosporaceae bacterium]|nr:chitinase [Micromonosporaceae bacterium]